MIQKKYEDDKKHVHVLSYGGGTQSTAMLLMALEGKFNGVIPDYIIFSDTGWETEKVLKWVDHVNEYIKKRFDREIIIVKNNLREDLIREDEKRVASLPYFTKTKEGKKGMVMRQCTFEYKINPVKQKVRRLLGYEPRKRVKEIVHMWKGISVDEIQRVKPIKDKWLEAEHPLIDLIMMDREECIEYVQKEMSVKPPSSSCIGCPFHNNDVWLDMKLNDPQSFKDACEVDEMIRKRPKLEAECFLHRSCVPLKDVKFESEDTNNLINECEGFCGV